MNIYLETSTLLPLLYITPYTEHIISHINSLPSDTKLFIHQDCLLEIRGMLETGYINNQGRLTFYNGVRVWKDIPEERARLVTNSGLQFSRDNAISLLIGGDITPLGNYNRFQAFLFHDLVDVSNDWNQFIQNIENRRTNLINTINCWIANQTFNITNNILPGWGTFYNQQVLIQKSITIFEDNLPEFSNNIAVSWNVSRTPITGPFRDAIQNLLTHPNTSIRCKFPWNGRSLTIVNNNMTVSANMNRDKYHFLAVCQHANHNNWALLVADGRFAKMCQDVNLYPGALSGQQNALLNHIINLNTRKTF